MIHATMHCEESGGDRQEYAFHVPAVVGRSKLADVTILHSLISRKHCELFETNDGRLAIRDLDSLNGTFVGQSRIKQCVLKPGDRLTIGPFTYRIEYAIETAEDEATEELRSDQERDVATGISTDDPTTYPKASQGTTIESIQGAVQPGNRTVDEEEKATVTGSTEPPRIGQPDPEPVSNDDPAFQDFLKGLP